MKEKNVVKNTWYEWLISYITEHKKSVGCLKDSIVSALKDKNINVLEKKTKSFLKINTPKETVYGRGQKLRKPRKRIIKKPFISEENKEIIKDRIIRDIWKLFETEEKKEEDERLNKDKIIRDIRTLFEQQEEDFYKPKLLGWFLE